MIHILISVDEASKLNSKRQQFFAKLQQKKQLFNKKSTKTTSFKYKKC